MNTFTDSYFTFLDLFINNQVTSESLGIITGGFTVMFLSGLFGVCITLIGYRIVNK